MLKPGWKTTEFAVTVLTAVAAFVASVADYLPPRYAALTAAVIGGLYAVSRGLAKQPPAVVPPPSPTTVAPPQ
jgi:hypothetical protein